MEGPFLDHHLTRLHQGTSRCVIGLMPVSHENPDAPSSEVINANITGFIAPSFQLQYVTDGSYKGLVHIPVTEDNAFYDKILSIGMICDGRQENYWALFRYMKTIQSGQTNGFPIEDKTHRIYGFDNHYRNRVSYIPYIDIIMSDDSYQKHQTIRFGRCFPLHIDQIDLHFKSPDPVTFSAHFIFTTEDIVREDPPKENTTPLGVTD